MKLSDLGCNVLHHRGISHSHRLKLEDLHRGGQEIYSVEEISEIWQMPRMQARRLLAHLATSGWLVRVRQGRYATIPLEASQPHTWQIDSWVAAQEAFEPCYIGGWSAGEHWSLTEQMFRELLVVTARPVRVPHPQIQGTRILLYHRSQEKHFGTRSIWRGQTRVLVSDPSKTIVDVLADPAWAGGIRHGADMLTVYFEDHADESRLLDYIEHMGNHTVYKRLGYLCELLKLGTPDLLTTCEERLSRGLSLLDPSAPPSGPIVTRWAIRINVRVRREQSA